MALISSRATDQAEIVRTLRLAGVGDYWSLSDWEGDTDVTCDSLTTLSAQASAGTSVLEVGTVKPFNTTDSNKTFRAGDTLYVDPGGANQEQVTVSYVEISPAKIFIDETLANTHASTTKVGSNLVLECYSDGSPYTIGELESIGGATSTAECRRIIRPASGQGHDGTPNSGVKFNGGILLVENYLRLEDVIVDQPGTSGGSGVREAIRMSGNEIYAVGCILKADNAGSGTARGVNAQPTTGSKVYVVNCVIYDCKSYGIYGLGSGTGTVYAYNCTVRNSSRNLYRVTGVATAKNVLSDAGGISDFGGTWTDSYNNASSDATAPGTDSRTNQTFTFVDAASDDYHLHADDAGARTYGLDLSADANLAFNDDIDGTERDGWDIGADGDAVSADGDGAAGITRAGRAPPPVKRRVNIERLHDYSSIDLIEGAVP